MCVHIYIKIYAHVHAGMCVRLKHSTSLSITNTSLRLIHPKQFIHPQHNSNPTLQPCCNPQITIKQGNYPQINLILDKLSTVSLG